MSSPTYCLFLPRSRISPLSLRIVPADDVGDLLERETVLPQRGLRDLDRDLVALGATDVGG
jgi:hypothetical protein